MSTRIRMSAAGKLAVAEEILRMQGCTDAEIAARAPRLTAGWNSEQLLKEFEACQSSWLCTEDLTAPGPIAPYYVRHLGGAK